MKKLIIYSILLTLFSISFTGCGAKVKPEDNKLIPLLKSFGKKDKSKVFYNGWLKVERDNEIGTVAVVLKDVATYYKASGYTHFTFYSFNRVPFVITNMSDLVSYCYPESIGFSKKGLHSKDTSLEYGKCSLKYEFKEKNIGVSIGFMGYKGNNSAIPMWSVEEVLADKNIDKYIEAMLDDMQIVGKNRKIPYRFK